MEKLLILCLMLFLVTACKNETNENSDPFLIKVYYKNGRLRQTYRIDQSGELHGFFVDYDATGKIKAKMIYYHGKEMIAKFYKNGKIYQQQSSYINGMGINSTISFDSSGKVKQAESQYAQVKYLSKDSLKISLPNFYRDSILVLFKKSFETEGDERDYVRKVRFIKPNEPEVNLKILNTDYVNDRLNIEVISFEGKTTIIKDGAFPVRLSPERKSILIQLDKDEKPKAYNIDAIW